MILLLIILLFYNIQLIVYAMIIEFVVSRVIIIQEVIYSNNYGV